MVFYPDLCVMLLVVANAQEPANRNSKCTSHRPVWGTSIIGGGNRHVKTQMGIRHDTANSLSCQAAEPKHGYFTARDGVKIHYVQVGDRGSHVILIHGYFSNAERNWFANGIASALAKNHRVVAIDCRNHGLSDKPVLRGVGIPEDVIDLINHLKIEKAHFHGYSMGGSIVGQLLASTPELFITAGFGGSGIPEHDPEWMTRVPEDKKGKDPEDETVTRLIVIGHLMNDGMSREEAVKAADEMMRPQVGQSASPPQSGPKMDLSKVTVPVLAINGGFDVPYSKTHRMWRELRNFTNVVLPGKSHVTAIAATYMPPEYLDALVRFINANDP